MFVAPKTTQVARKRHQCTNCCEYIERGETYVRWYSVDDAGFTNKMHPECYSSLEEGNDGGFWEYSPYSGERPAA